MPILPGFEYDVFISYRQKDNKYDNWVTEFVSNLQKELATSFKEEVTIYFDENPHDGLLETHNVDKSLDAKLKSLLFVPIISQTYCDPNSYAWSREFIGFRSKASGDSIGLNVLLPSGNTASRVLPVLIGDLDTEDKQLFEKEIESALRPIEFIFRSPGVSRPLRSKDDDLQKQIGQPLYRDQINKVARAIKETIAGMKLATLPGSGRKPVLAVSTARHPRRPGLKLAYLAVIALAVAAIVFYLLKPAPLKREESLAVLAFSDMSPGKDQEHISDGLSEELINRLTLVPGLVVSSRTSSFAFKHKDEDARSIAAKLGVGYLLEGSVRKDGDMIRVTAQLISASDGNHLWSETYDRSIQGIFRVQDEIAESVVSQLKLKVFGLGHQLEPTVKVATVEGITEYRLQNGLRVLLFPDQSKQTITVNITYLVGSKHENYGETGMAHLLEHLVFKGTPKHPNIPQELTEHGTQPGGNTWLDYTSYFETFSATEENLKWALELEADRMVNSHIAKKDLESEMTVVRNEFEFTENSPTLVLQERVASTAFLWHNYGKSTIGSRADIENVPIDRLQEFYRKYYQPDNAVLIVAGKIDEPKTLDLINQHFGPTPKPSRVIATTYTVDPVQDGERRVTLRRAGDVQMVMAAFHIPGRSHPDLAPILVLSRILGSPPAGRLYKALVDTKEASRVSAYVTSFKDPSLLYAAAEVLKEKSLDDAKTTLLNALNEQAKTTFSEDEVKRAKNEIIKQIELSFNSSQSIAMLISIYAGIGDWRMLFLTRDRVKAVTVEDVGRVAAYYLKEDNRTLGTFIPSAKTDRAEIPVTPEVDGLVKDYKGNAPVVEGEAFDPAPANIESRTTRSDLPNGAKLALLPKKTRGESVDVRITLRFGNEESLAGKAQAGEFAASMLNKGTSKHTRQQIKDEFDRLKANVFFVGSATTTSISIATTRPNLAEVIKLVGEVLKDPSFPAEELEKLRSESLAQLETGRGDPQAIGQRKFAQHINPYPKNDPRHVPSFDEKAADIKAVTLEEVRKFYKEVYGITSGTTISAVGDFDAAEMKTLISEIFGTWNSATPYARLAGKLFSVTTINQTVQTPDKANAFFTAGFNFEMRDDHPDFPAMTLGNFMVGGGFLNSRLAVRIRQKDGLSYAVGSQFSAGSIDPIATLSAFAIYAPENLEKLERAFHEEIAKVITDGFTPEEVAAAQSGWLQSRTVSHAQDAFLSNGLANYLFIKRDYSWDAALEKKVAALTAGQINGVMKKYLVPGKLNIIKVGDFAKSKKKTN